jgi:hypothetical protein
VNKAANLEQLAEMADEPLKGQLKAMIKVQNARAAELIKLMKGKTGLTDEELKKFDIEALERMVKVILPAAPLPDYSGAAAAAAPQTQERRELFTPPTKLFPVPNERAA